MEVVILRCQTLKLFSFNFKITFMENTNPTVPNLAGTANDSQPTIAAQSVSSSGTTTNVWNLPRVGGECITEPSPEAAAMRRYQDMPVSHVTGTADISIPLLELPSRRGGAAFSIGLSYHTGGIKRSDIASYVGLGWSLTGLGQISRQIKGRPDEVNDRNRSFQPLPDNTYDKEFYEKVYKGFYDTEHDLYSYSVPGYSGHFIIDTTKDDFGQEKAIIKQLPKSEVRIIRTGTGNGPFKFVIHTPDGVTYIFNESDEVSFTSESSPARELDWAPVDYKAQTTWYVTQISHNTEGDYATISYRTVRPWSRSQSSVLDTINYSHIWKRPDTGSYIDEHSVTQHEVGHSNVTTFNKQRIPLLIKSQTGTIEFNIKTSDNRIRSGSKEYIDSMILKDNDGNVIKEVSLRCDSAHNDGRRCLDEIEIRADNERVGLYDFSYASMSTRPGSDIFGYANSDIHPNRSVLDRYDPKKWANRKPEWTSAMGGLLESIIDISGAETTLEYEPATVEFSRIDGGLIQEPIEIGVRIREICTRCETTGRTRRRTYRYDDARCSLDLTNLRISDFMSQSGTRKEETIDGNSSYTLGVSLLASPNLGGAPLESAVVYYGKVTEELSGTGMEHPVKTVYEYDLDSAISSLSGNDGMDTPCLTSKAFKISQFSEIYRVGDPIDRFPLKYYPSRAYFQEKIGISPTLKQVSYYERVENEYKLREQQRHTYRVVDSETVYAGTHCESSVFKVSPYRGIPVDEFDCINDMSYYSMYAETERYEPLQTEVTRYYDDGNERTVSTKHYYRGVEMIRYSGFDYDKTVLTNSTHAFRQLGSKTTCGNDSISNFKLESWFSKQPELREACYDRYNAMWPEAEKWILKSDKEKETIQRLYRYKSGDPTPGADFPGLMPCEVSVVREDSDGGEPAVLSRQIYHSYDPQLRITGMTDAQGRHVKAKWISNTDCLSEMSFDDQNLKTTYTHRPLVGCTSIQSPSGKVRNFTYEAGRLVGESNSAGQPVATYGYRSFYGDDGKDGANVITCTRHDDLRNTTDSVYYDGFGMPVQKFNTVASRNSVANVSCYDALDRPVRQYLPLPVANSNYIGTGLENLVKSHYNDQRPFSETLYRGIAGDQPVEIIKEGANMLAHSNRLEYICNNQTDAMLCCRKYKLTTTTTANGREAVEEVTLTGNYSGGMLDVVRSTDADGCTLLTFTDWRGFKILERRVVDEPAGTFADTYFLYDLLGQLRVILQPEGSVQMDRAYRSWKLGDENDLLGNYAFIYRYDRRGNCIYSKMPGAGAVKMYYDPHNRPAFRSTAVMQQNGMSEMMVYDRIGRQVLTAITRDPIPDEIPDMTTSLERMMIIIPVEGEDNNGEGKIDFSTGGLGGVDGTGYPLPEGLDLQNLTVTSANYYDSYQCNSIPEFSELLLGFDVNATCAKGMLTATRTAVHSVNFSDIPTVSSRPDSLYTVFSYDREGRLVSTVSNRAKTGVRSKSTTTYSRQGLPLTIEQQLTGTSATNTLVTTNTYDGAGVLKSARATYNGKSIEPKFSYDNCGRLTGIQFKDTGNSIEYSYDMRGRVTGIKHPAFSQTLCYDSGEEPCYNGNISSMSVKYGDGDPVTRQYSYDHMNRLISAVSGDGNSMFCTYNLNSAPESTTVYKNGRLTKKYVFSYIGNRLDSRMNEASITPNTSIENYFYDIDGRLVSRVNQTTKNITYALNGQPVLYSAIANNLSTGKTVYKYRDDGHKLSVRDYTAMVPSRPTVLTPSAERFYEGPFEFEDKGQGSESNPQIKRVNTRWGFFDSEGNTRLYIPDYQGNIRAVVDGETAETVQQVDYYPYGTPVNSPQKLATNRYLFSGKEYQDGEYDFEARRLDPDNLSFNRPDPKAADTPWLSPYLYCAANPIMYIDPTGEKIVIPDSAPQQFKDTYNEARAIMKEKGIDGIMSSLDSREGTIYLVPHVGKNRERSANSHYDPSNNTIYWDPNEAVLYGNFILTPIELLSHEADHALQHLDNPAQQKIDSKTDDDHYNNKEERRVITGSETENSIKLGKTQPGEYSRDYHKGNVIKVNKLFDTIQYYLDNIEPSIIYNTPEQ